MYLFLQQNRADNGSAFDLDVIWNSMANLLKGFLARLPYIIVALVVFGFFLVIGKIISRVIRTAGERTRFDTTLADLLARLSTFVVTILGTFVAEMVKLI